MTIVEKHSAAAKILPSDPIAEANVLGSSMASPEALAECVALTKPEHFLADAHRLIADAVWALDARGEPVGVITVAAWMRNHGTLERAGGVEVIEQLSDRSRDFDHVFSHAKTVHAWFGVRRVLTAAQRLVAEGLAGPPNLAAWIDSAASRIEQAAVGNGQARAGRHIGEVLDELEAEWNSPTGEVVLSTGIKSLDALLGGLRPGGLYVIGAWSSLGKTALAAGIADHVAVHGKIGDHRCGVMLVSVEMADTAFVKRMLTSRASINNRRFTKRLYPFISGEEHARKANANKALRESSTYIYDESNITISWVRAEARRLKSQMETEGRTMAVLLVDYAQLLASDVGAKHGNREQEVAAVARAMKNLAKECNVAILLPAQLNETGRENGRPPAAYDLRESRELHHAADAVILVDNPAYNPATSRNPANMEAGPAEPVNLIVDKARGEGVTGTARAAYWPGITRFTDWDEAASGPHVIVRPTKKGKDS